MTLPFRFFLSLTPLQHMAVTIYFPKFICSAVKVTIDLDSFIDKMKIREDRIKKMENSRGTFL